mmetsp:Transcript_2245/g.3372  ORF Transcript_2245/g.3372 Transcript_2245/m.3372 type:complete len:134 (+) Transcript_2245:117-518(+)
MPSPYGLCIKYAICAILSLNYGSALVKTLYLGFTAIYHLLAAFSFCVKSAIFFSIVIASLPVYLYKENQRRNSSSANEWNGRSVGQYHDDDGDSTDSDLSAARSHLEPDEVIEAKAVISSFDTSDSGSDFDQD